MIDRPSPNHDERRHGTRVEILLLHYTGMRTAGDALARLCDPKTGVSAHYTIDEDGTVYRHVAEDRRAWHAGVAAWRGITDVNSASVGIELVNPGHEFGYRGFPEAQMAALITLAHGIVARHGIPPEGVLGHSDVAPQRKQDPGEKFDWAGLAAAGIGLWPFATYATGAVDGGGILAPGSEGPGVARMQEDLARFGYAVPKTGVMDPETVRVVEAFQRHFRQAAVTGAADTETRERLAALLAAVGSG